MATDIRDLNKQESQAVAIRMSERMRRIRDKANEMTERTTRIVVATGSAFGLGMWMGGLELERKQLIDEGKLTESGEGANGESDPTKFYNMDKDLLVGLGLAAMAVTKVGGAKASPMVSAAAIGTLSSWAGARGRQMGYQRASDQG